jgi:hypothetical protein
MPRSGIQQLPQFVRVSVTGDLLLARVLGNGRRNGIVQPPVQRAEILSADGCVRFRGQIGHGLAHVAIFMHDLRHGKTLT